GAQAASDARVTRRSPPTDVPETSWSTPQQDYPARRPRWWPGRMAVQIGCPPASPVLLSPTTCRDILGNPVGRRDHGQRQDAECGHPLLPVDARTPALARRLHNPRAHGVLGKYRKITRPLPPPAAPTLSS